jgi:hypothetical protein
MKPGKHDTGRAITRKKMPQILPQVKNKASQSIDLQGFMKLVVIRIGFEPMTPSLEG